MSRQTKLKNAIRNNKRSLLLVLVGVVAVIAFAILINLVVRVPGSDDEAFPKQIEPYSTVVDWVTYRYESWSGRIFAEGFVYTFSTLPLIVWKLITIGLYAVFLFFAYRYYKLWSKSISLRKDVSVFAIIAISPLFIHLNSLMDGLFWSTGSMNYFWILALGFVAMYPIAFLAAKKTLPKTPYLIASILTVILAASSQEQVGAIIAGLTFTFAGYYFTVNRKHLPAKQSVFLATFLLVALVAFLVNIQAPGNDERFTKELRWIPDLLEVSLLARVEYSLRWFIDALINHSGIILSGMWVLLGTLSFVKNTKKTTVLGIVFIIAALLMLLRSLPSISYLFKFYATWNWNPIPEYSFIFLLPWLCMLALTACAPLFIYGRTPKGYILALIIAAGMASTAVIALSPTMYISGWRVLLVPLFVLLMANIFLLSDVFAVFKDRIRMPIVTILLCIAAASYIYILFHFIADFSSLLLKM